MNSEQLIVDNHNDNMAESLVIHIGMGEGMIVQAPRVLSSTGIGSCVVLTMYDTRQGIGAMAHVMLPEQLRHGDTVKRRNGDREKRGDVEADDSVSGSPWYPFPATSLPPVPCIYADTAIALILIEMQKAGAEQKHIVAKMAGGANMFDYSEGYEKHLGIENIRSLKKTLRKRAIPLIGEDVGGHHGRSVVFYLDSGRLVIRAFEREDKEI